MVADYTNGKRIHELEFVNGIQDETMFAVSHNGLTRRCNANDIAIFLNGDVDEPSNDRFYSSEEITRLFSLTGEKMNDLAERIRLLQIALDDLTEVVQENYRTLDDRITNVYNTLNNKINTWILYGSSRPSGQFQQGRLYCQYFN